MALSAAGRGVLLAIAAALPLTAGACSSDKRPSAASASAPASASASATASSTAASASPSSSASSAPTGPCDAPAPASSAVNVSHAGGDFNADGAADTLTVYGTGTATKPSPYHVQIELAASHGRVDAVIVDAATDDNQVVKALGGADIRSSAGAGPRAGDVAFVQIGSGASDTLVGGFALDGCVLTRLTGPQGAAPSTFPIGGSVTHLDGLRCDGTAGGQRLVQLSATSADGVTYQTTATTLTIDNGHFAPATPVTDTIAATDARLQDFSALACPGVEPP